MKPIQAALLIFVSLGCRGKEPSAPPVESPPPPPAAPPEPPEPERTPAEKRAEDLGAAHNQVWQMMGLSEEAQRELNQLVTKFNAQTAEAGKRPAGFEAAMQVGRVRQEKRAHKPKGKEPSLTYEEFVADHAERYRLLGVSEKTQAELTRAGEWVWKALHDQKAPPEQREKALVIQSMMRAMASEQVHMVLEPTEKQPQEKQPQEKQPQEKQP